MGQRTSKHKNQRIKTLILLLMATFLLIIIPSVTASAADVTDFFNRPNSATVGGGWSETEAGGTAAISSKALLITKTAAGETLTYQTWSNTTGNDIRFRIKTNNVGASSYFYAYDGADVRIQVGFNNNDLVYRNSGGSYVDIGNPVNNVYYHIRLTDINWTANTYDIYIDGALTVNDADMTSHTGVVPATVKISASSNAAYTMTTDYIIQSSTPDNGYYLNFSFKDQKTTSAITDPVNVTLINLAGSRIYYGTIGELLITSTTDYYEIRYDYPDYVTSRHYVNLTRSYNITAYLLNSTYTTNKTFTIRNPENELIEGADVTFYRMIGGAYHHVDERVTDISGGFIIKLESLTTYKIIINKTGYPVRTVYLEPSSNTYTIYLSNAAGQSLNYYDAFSVNTKPSNNIISPSNTNFTLTINSPSNKITYYGMKTSFNGTDYENNDTTSSGGVVNITLDLTSHRGESVNINYYSLATGYELLSFNRTFYITSINNTNTSIQAIAETVDNAGVSSLVKTLFAIGMIIFVVVTFAPFIPPAGLGVIGVIGMIIFSIIGWIPMMISVPALIITVGVWFMMSRQGGNP